MRYSTALNRKKKKWERKKGRKCVWLHILNLYIVIPQLHVMARYSMRRQGLVGYKSNSNHIQRLSMAPMLLRLHISALCTSELCALKRDVPCHRRVPTRRVFILKFSWNFCRQQSKLSTFQCLPFSTGLWMVCVCCLYALRVYA